eukprot:3705296-Pleurochrysis_carterae.AAC.1
MRDPRMKGCDTATEDLPWRPRALRDAWVQLGDIGLEHLAPPERTAWRLDRDKMDAAIMTKCIAPIGAAGSSGISVPYHAAPRDLRATACQPPRAWGTAQSVLEDMAPRMTSEASGKVADARREVSSDEESVREVHPKRRRAESTSPPRSVAKGGGQGISRGKGDDFHSACDTGGGVDY